MKPVHKASILACMFKSGATKLSADWLLRVHSYTKDFKWEEIIILVGEEMFLSTEAGKMFSHLVFLLNEGLLPVNHLPDGITKQLLEAANYKNMVFMPMSTFYECIEMLNTLPDMGFKCHQCGGSIHLTNACTHVGEHILLKVMGIHEIGLCEEILWKALMWTNIYGAMFSHQTMLANRRRDAHQQMSPLPVQSALLLLPLLLPHFGNIPCSSTSNEPVHNTGMAKLINHKPIFLSLQA
ncbi:hypothetical protein BDN71DRAFT_1435748 [Pleurotus eryngii]|uniref:Uncharacterized protein n=1 Tax=Pleurotus eryngii TaxID=5323 RepID=A0A9P6D1M3_PLEER|nr:hypothetical protein BDN71DRAFT_1435748 [Pleurotus eryngii]